MSSKDEGVIQVLLERFNEHRLPRAMRIKERIDEGAVLTSEELEYLELVLEDAHQIRPILDRNPEYKDLVARAIDLYHEITTKALENEKKT